MAVVLGRARFVVQDTAGELDAIMLHANVDLLTPYDTVQTALTTMKGLLAPLTDAAILRQGLQITVPIGDLGLKTTPTSDSDIMRTGLFFFDTGYGDQSSSPVDILGIDTANIASDGVSIDQTKPAVSNFIANLSTPTGAMNWLSFDQDPLHTPLKAALLTYGATPERTARSWSGEPWYSDLNSYFGPGPATDSSLISQPYIPFPQPVPLAGEYGSMADPPLVSLCISQQFVPFIVGSLKGLFDFFHYSAPVAHNTQDLVYEFLKPFWKLNPGCTPLKPIYSNWLLTSDTTGQEMYITEPGGFHTLPINLNTYDDPALQHDYWHFNAWMKASFGQTVYELNAAAKNSLDADSCLTVYYFNVGTLDTLGSIITITVTDSTGGTHLQAGAGPFSLADFFGSAAPEKLKTIHISCPVPFIINLIWREIGC